MEKYKICPSCGAKNLPTRIECDQCEADLTGVPVTADMPEEKKEAASRFVRICDCGAKNLPQARRCAVCGEDISDIPAVEIGEEEPTKSEKDRPATEATGSAQTEALRSRAFSLPKSDQRQEGAVFQG